MGMTEETQEFVAVSEMVGRHVEVATKDFEIVVGVLHSLSNHGILVKSDDTGDYEFFPWSQIKMFVHVIKKPGEKIIKKEEEIQIVDTPATMIQETLDEDYEWDWEDSDEAIALITNTEGEEVIKVDTVDDEIYVYNEKDLNTAKILARKFNIKKITRDYKL